MGDRCWLQVTLRGEITSMRQLVWIVRAFKNDSGFGGNTTRLEILDTIATALREDTNPEFTDDERNYANIDDLENDLRAGGVTYSVQHNEGGGFAGGQWSWAPEGGKHSVLILPGDNDPAIPVHELEAAMGMPNALELIKGLIDNANKATGYGLPVFSIEGEAVIRYFAKIEAARALLAA